MDTTFASRLSRYVGTTDRPLITFKGGQTVIRRVLSVDEVKGIVEVEGLEIELSTITTVRDV